MGRVLLVGGLLQQSRRSGGAHGGVGVGGLQLQMAASLAKAGSAPEAGCCSHMANAYGQNKEHVEEHPLEHDYPTQNQESPACTCQWDVAWLLSWTGNHLADAEVSDKGSL